MKDQKAEIAKLNKNIDTLEFENQELEEKVQDLTKQLEDLKPKEPSQNTEESNTGRYSS